MSAFLTDLLHSLSLEEKAGQLNLLAGTMDQTGTLQSTDLAAAVRSGNCGAVLNVFTPAATRTLQELALQSRHQIPLLFGYDVIHGHRTLFPIPLALSCSWNLDLIERCARAAATEAAADGLHWVFSPMVDISQDPRWGRVAEGAGEDPWLGAEIAAAMVRGYQGNDLAAPTTVLACVKHFALYGASLAGRDYHSVDMSRRAMEETYFPPYRAAIAAGARTVMTSFNEIDGIPASGNRWLLDDVLRQQWGFQGWIVSDYTAVSEMKHHGTAATDADAAHQALTAGVDMDMVSECFLRELPQLVKSGGVPQETLDAAVLRILQTKWDLGLFENPFSRCEPPTTPPPDFTQLAREAALESIVLLQNHTQLLPLRKTKTLAVIGPLAASQRDLLGCWIAAGNVESTPTLLDSIRVAASPATTVLFSENEDAAATADLVILVLGETADLSGEAASRTDIRLPKSQRDLAQRVLATGTPCVLVTLSGRPLDLSWEAEHFPTILHGWALGSQAGPALAAILFGTAAPVGKLTMGFPRHVGQLPMTYREKPSGRPFDPAVKYTSKYLDSPNDALFPFGHGLTYAQFHLSPPTVDFPELPRGGTLTASIVITNLSPHSATETLQLYLRDPVASVTRPIKELRRFQRITLAAHASHTVSFTLTEADLTFPDRNLHPTVEPGDFHLMIGPNSRDLQFVKWTLLEEGLGIEN